MNLTEKQDCPHIRSKPSQKFKHKSERQRVRHQIKNGDEDIPDNYGKYTGWVD